MTTQTTTAAARRDGLGLELKSSPSPTTHKDPIVSPSSLGQAESISTESPSKATAAFTLRRVDSSYSLSRASFASQLAQLSSLQIPEAASLKSQISAIPRATEAARALKDAAEQIRKWIDKASQVLTDLDAEDDVEWAAAGGREGLGEVDTAVKRFEGLIGVYVGSIEELQSRVDVATVPPTELNTVVVQMEKTFVEWEKIRAMLRNVKQQVELAMEWEELQNVVLGDIGLEIEELGRLVFEMEEARHRSLLADANAVDLGELETIVEETQPQQASNGFNLPPALAKGSPLQSPGMSAATDDSNLLALFARMQPLRASLDFLPMRLSSFNSSARQIFKTACDELDERRRALEQDWKDLERDAEALRRELGEDRWVLVFRNAGRQAQKMCESVGRSVVRVREAIEAGAQHSNPPSLAKKLESYEAKKTHYGPAIERVLAIIERGVADRLTLNGEILRLRKDADAQWKALVQEMREMDGRIEALHLSKDQQLRDSISTILSYGESTVDGSVNTPGSSPASSVVMNAGGNVRNDSFASSMNGKIRSHPGRHSTLPRPSGDRRNFTMPTPSTTNATGTTATTPRQQPSTPRSNSRMGSPSRTGHRPSTTGGQHPLRSRPSLTAEAGRPRWNSSVSTRDTGIGHNFKPLTLTTPSPHRKTPLARASASNLKAADPRRERSHSPSLSASTSHLPLSFRDRVASPLPGRQSVTSSETPKPRLRNTASTSVMNTSRLARPSLGTSGAAVKAGGSSLASLMEPPPARPASAMAGGRRSSLLPAPKTPTVVRSSSGRASMIIPGRDHGTPGSSKTSATTTASSSRTPSTARFSTSLLGSGTGISGMRPPSRSGREPAKDRPAWR